jgi:hypothetical protein
MDAFAGIDVAFAKRKRLPVSLCVRDERGVIPLPVAAPAAPNPPRGRGNAATLHENVVADFAEEVADYLRQLETHFAVKIRRIGIDAPSDPRVAGASRRKAEAALDLRRINCFTTPSSADFVRIRNKARGHLEAGGSESRLPHANQLWMLVGFAVFERLRREWDCLEVFPQATVCVLGANALHKSQRGGVDAQLAVVAQFTGWPQPPRGASLKTVVHGPAHDGLDAYMSAWVAALGIDERLAFGQPPDDAIWVPQLGTPAPFRVRE